MAVRYVMVVRPERTAPAQELVLPGNVEAYTSTPIFSRTDGYLKEWYVDIGATVKRGQVLAVIDTPEVDQQLLQARDVLAAAEAALRLAEITAKRYTELLATKSVSQQDVDTAVGSLQQNQATVAADRAEVRRLDKLKAFQVVRAPFDGLITARNTDVGDLINAGSSTTLHTELFHMVQSTKLRVYVSVPEAVASNIVPGLVAKLALAATPGRTFTGKIVRTASAIAAATRTLQVEIGLDNPTGLLFAGTYAEVRIEVPSRNDLFTLPVETLVFRKEGLQVATVVADRVALKTIEPGRDFGERIEVVRGLTAGDLVIVSPPDSITEGEQVRLAKPPEKPGTLARPGAPAVRKSE
jgi:RND family efflux transporter MFP subunit